MQKREENEDHFIYQSYTPYAENCMDSIEKQNNIKEYLPSKSRWTRIVFLEITKMPTEGVKSINAYLDLFIKISLIGAGIVLFTNYLSRKDIFIDKTKDYRELYKQNILPLEIEILGALLKKQKGEKNSEEEFQISKDKFLSENSSGVKLYRSVDDFEEIIGCNKSWLCMISDYYRYEDSIMNFWYSFKEEIQEMRTYKSSFGSVLENEARSICNKKYTKETTQSCR